MSRKTVDQWFAEYGESHQNPLNKLIHWFCVPLIYLVIFALLWEIPQPDWLQAIPLVNWAVLGAVVTMTFYVRLSKPLAKGLGVFTLLCLLFPVVYEQMTDTPLWLTSIIAFVILWIMQFVGHHIEGKKPSFFKDIQFLLIGPAWVVGFLYDRLGISYR